MTLTLANGYNLYEAFDPTSTSLLYRILDCFWPLSMATMLAVGITVVRAGVLTGWQRYVPLTVGLWLPFSFLVSTLMDGFSLNSCLPSGICSVIIW